MPKSNLLLKAILFLLSLPVLPASAQQQDDVHKKRFLLNPWENVNGWRVGASFRQNLEAEVSYIISSYPTKEQGYGGLVMPIQNIGAGLEYVRYEKQHAAGAKLSYEFSILMLSTQIGSDLLDLTRIIRCG